ncbi:TPA: hypothetical protein PMB01_001698 [Vibrio cholerae]|nr:hypothetical protein [Vibrio cholerae]
MSDEMKMSDYFALPVLHDVYMQDEHAPVYAADCNRIVFKGWYEPAIEFACHAINNHDRLTEENKRLREALEKIQRMQSRTPELPEDYTHEDVGDLNDRIDEVFGIVNTALSELGGE